MTTTEQRLRAALERAVAIVEANPLSYNPEGRLYRIGDIAHEALAAAPEDEGWRKLRELFADHYWDTFQGERDLIMAHVDAVLALDLHEEGKR